MRWEIYLSQTQGAGRVALAVALACFGLFLWWYLIQVAPWLAAWRPRLTTGFWIMVGALYFILMGFIFFAWPEV